MKWGTWRVNGQLAVSRAIGEFKWKNRIIHSIGINFILNVSRWWDNLCPKSFKQAFGHCLPLFLLLTISVPHVYLYGTWQLGHFWRENSCNLKLSWKSFLKAKSFYWRILYSHQNCAFWNSDIPALNSYRSFGLPVHGKDQSCTKVRPIVPCKETPEFWEGDVSF